MNVYTFTGRLGNDAETRYTQHGSAICSFSVAVDYGYGDNKGTHWIRCSMFGKAAEGKLPEFLVKGKSVAVSGELRVREFDDKNGNKQKSVEVNAWRVDLLGSNSDGNRDDSGNRNGSQPQSDPFGDDDIPF